MTMPHWAALLIIILHIIILIGCISYLIYYLINNHIKNKKISKLEGRPLEIGMADVVSSSNYSPIVMVNPALSIYETKEISIPRETIYSWLEDLATVWENQTKYYHKRSQVFYSLFNTKIAFIPFKYLTTPEGLASGLCYYPQKHIYITIKDKKNNNRKETELKSLFIHETSHIVLFQSYPEIPGEKHHDIFKECGIS